MNFFAAMCELECSARELKPIMQKYILVFEQINLL